MRNGSRKIMNLKPMNSLCSNEISGGEVVVGVQVRKSYSK
jgi:hypothetical protein